MVRSADEVNTGGTKTDEDGQQSAFERSTFEPMSRAEHVIGPTRSTVTSRLDEMLGWPDSRQTARRRRQLFDGSTCPIDGSTINPCL